MENIKELIVPFNKEGLKVGLAVVPFVTLVLCLLFTLSFLLKNIFGFYVTLMIQIILGLFIALFILGFINTLFLMKDEKPAAILNQEGIWVKYYGFIPWQNVEEVMPYIYSQRAPIEVVGITVKDTSSLFWHASFTGKMGVFWSKIFKYPPIQLSNITLTNEEVISFAHHCMRK